MSVKPKEKKGNGFLTQRKVRVFLGDLPDERLKEWIIACRIFRTASWAGTAQDES